MHTDIEYLSALESMMQYILQDPLYVSPSLKPALRVDDAVMQIHPVENDGTHIRWRITITADDGTWLYDEADLRTPIHSVARPETRATYVFEALLSFLSACAESYPDGENSDLFPPECAEWAQQHSGGIEYAAITLQELGDDQ